MLSYYCDIFFFNTYTIYKNHFGHNICISEQISYEKNNKLISEF